jgi:bifunctional DNA-binding transcriptional regulator/antitoxin component of YhaV-PrlF toxin-antitoxin module
MEFYPFSFDTEVSIRDFGKYHYVCVKLPSELEAALPFDQYPRLRVRGEMAGYDFEGAWQPQKGGQRWLMIPKDIQKAAGLSIGDRVHVAFGIADQDAVNVPAELAEALAEAPDAREAWDALTPGKRRGHCHAVEKAKAPATKQKRIAEIFDQLDF